MMDLQIPGACQLRLRKRLQRDFIYGGMGKSPNTLLTCSKVGKKLYDLPNMECEVVRMCRESTKSVRLVGVQSMEQSR
ncbi:MAG: hypothetical protein E7294_11115 [Lachnospiraceae bacterium]|nr:hypothetical protein [Lachnospiraceae bacterium]